MYIVYTECYKAALARGSSALPSVLFFMYTGYYLDN